MSKLENLIRLASKTFAAQRCRETQAGGSSAESPYVKFQNLFSELILHTNQITGEDVGLPKMLHFKSRLSKQFSRPTALYCQVFGNSAFLISIFILYPKSTLPLHSHPGMYGILKVIDGEIQVRTYTSLNKIDFTRETIPTFEATESSHVMDKNTEPAIITPENNLHEIVNLHNHNAAVFLDVLSPPYVGDNCYFSSKNIKNELYELSQAPCPAFFSTISIPFEFPSS